MITKRANSPYYYSEFMLNGKRFIKSTKTKNKSLALQIDQQLYNEAVKQSAFSGDDITLDEAFKLFIGSKNPGKSYKTQLNAVHKWFRENIDIKILLSDIDTKFLYKIVNLRSVDSKQSTIKHDLVILNGVLNFCKKLDYNVGKYDLPVIKVKDKKTRVLTKDEEARLLSALKEPVGGGIGPFRKAQIYDNYICAVLLLDTGCRWNEIANLKWEQVDLDNKIFNIWRSKTSSASILPISDRAYQLLLDKPRKSEWVFPNESNTGPKTYSAGTFANACKRAGIEGVTWHTLRHTTITRLTLAGLSLSQVQAISGHSSVSSLERYQHLSSHDVIDKARKILNS
ncbi:MAG: tyrosine-type recombinase/integrase [Methylobacter sp.]